MHAVRLAHVDGHDTRRWWTIALVHGAPFARCLCLSLFQSLGITCVKHPFDRHRPQTKHHGYATACCSRAHTRLLVTLQIEALLEGPRLTEQLRREQQVISSLRAI